MHDLVMKLDEWGMPAWIALMVVGFILFWPIGLGVLAYLIWSGRMGCAKNGNGRRWQARMGEAWTRGDWRAPWPGSKTGSFGSSGNRAFDEYREETLKRLEEESREFQGFLERLRHAKDRAEFDQFMAERRARPSSAPTSESNNSGGLNTGPAAA